VLVNAAGIPGPIGPLWDADPEEWRRAVEVNLFGTFLCCRAVLPLMMERRRGKIVNFSGGGATSPLPRMGAYGASKAAVVRLTETLAEEVKPFNIAVNAIAPGLVDTRLQDPVLAAGTLAGDQFARVRRLRDTGEGGVPPELPAALALWLASDDAHGLTGKLISAPYDGWRRWDERRIVALKGSAWFTLRRLDHATLRPLIDKITGDPG
jgi:3-oxoacyl-[acyl-carrier protein] reductase